MIQSRTQQRQILEAAKRDSSLDSLLWYMVSDVGGGKSVAAAVNEWVPVVRVGSDPAVTEHDAHLMLELAKHYAPKMLLRLELTAIDILEASGVTWFEFGSVDLVCPTCGAVGWESCCCKPNLRLITDGERVMA